MSEEHFQFSDGSSNKFWKIRLDGSSFTVHFGRVGTAGQVQTKDFKSDAEAEKEYKKLVAEKLKKGYQRLDACDAPVPESREPRATQCRPAGSATATAGDKSSGQPTSSIATLDPPTPAAPTSAPGSDSPAPPIAAASATSSGAAGSPASSAGSAAEAPAPTVSQGKINFSSEDRERAAWGVQRPPRVRPQTQAFDRDQCIQSLLEMNKGPEHWDADWSNKDMDFMTWSGQEAHFWLVALSTAQTYAYSKMDKFRRVAAFEGDDPAKLKSLLLQFNFRDEVSYAEVEQIVTGTRGRPEHFCWVPYPLARVLSPVDYVKFWASHLSKLSGEMEHGFTTLILPYLSDAELSALRGHIHEALNKLDPEAVKDHKYFPVEVLVASLLLMKDDLLPFIDAIPSGAFNGDYAPAIPRIIYGLNEGQLILNQFKRLKLRVFHPNDLYRWIGFTEHQGVDMAWDFTESARWEERDAMIEAVKKIVSKESAKRFILYALSQGKLEACKSWVAEHLVQSLEAMTDMAGGTRSTASDVRRALRNLCGQHDVKTIAPHLVAQLKALECLQDDEPESAARTAPPDWLATALDTVQASKKTKPIEFLQGVAYESVKVDGWRMTKEQLDKVLVAIQQSSAETMHPLVAAIRENADRRAFDRFIWDVMGRWQNVGGPPKEKWALLAVGFVGSEKMIPQLITLMTTWRESGFAARAQVGLECLRIYGTDFALMQIHDISQSPKLKSLRAKALEYMDAIAESRGMTKAELEDRIVPTCGLDDTGTREFDYGGRKFTFLFGPDLKPMVRDEKGAYKTDLPPATQKDDAELAKRSIEEWKELKKVLKTVAKVQARRLEQAMVTCRSWTRDAFETLLLSHPLMTNLIRRVVWAAYDDQGKVLQTFRVMEDRTLADEADRPADISGATKVAIIHPLHMTDEQKSKWGELFTDYEISALFPQIGRPIFYLEPEEQNANTITRFAKISLPSASVPGTLERLGWWRGQAEDAGCYHWHHKHFDDHNLTAFAEYEGIPMMMMQEWEDQFIENCYFGRGIIKEPYRIERVALKDVPPIVISEILYDLTTLTSRSKDPVTD